MVLAEAAAAAYSTVELLILLSSSDIAAVVVVVIGTHGLPDVNLIGLFKRKKDISSVFPEKNMKNKKKFFYLLFIIYYLLFIIYYLLFIIFSSLLLFSINTLLEEYVKVSWCVVLPYYIDVATAWSA
jgi:hypothetical protein